MTRLALAIGALWLAGLSAPAAAELNTRAEVYQALGKCWVAPRVARPGMEITLLVAFTQAGAILGKPRISYETPEASEEQRLAYRIAMMAALQRCTPLHFSPSLAGAIAGRPFRIRFIDNRHLKQAERDHGERSRKYSET